MEISSHQNAVELQKNQAPKEVKVKEKGSFRAYGAAMAASTAVTPVGLLAVKGMQNVAGKLSPEQLKSLNECAEKMIKDTHLAEKGIKIVDYAGQAAESYMTNLPRNIEETFNTIAATANGKNAFFNPVTKEIGVNKGKLPTALFHEIGHAYNNNNSKFWSAMQKMRNPSMMLASTLVLFSAFSKKAEAEPGKELTTAQKAKNFVRKHAGALTALSMTPVVAEEVMASVRGVQYANKNLAKDLAKQVTKTNILGAISYIGAAVGFALASHVAIKVKDSIMEKQKAKAQQKQQQQINNKVK